MLAKFKLVESLLDELEHELPSVKGESPRRPRERVEVTIHEARKLVGICRDRAATEVARDWRDARSAADSLEAAANLLERAVSAERQVSTHALRGTTAARLRSEAARVRQVSLRILSSGRATTPGDLARAFGLTKSTAGPRLMEELRQLDVHLMAHGAKAETSSSWRERIAKTRADCERLIAGLRAVSQSAAERAVSARAVQLRDRAWANLALERHRFREAVYYVFPTEPAERADFRSESRRARHLKERAGQPDKSEAEG